MHLRHSLVLGIDYGAIEMDKGQNDCRIKSVTYQHPRGLYLYVGFPLGRGSAEKEMCPNSWGLSSASEGMRWQTNAF